MILVTCLLELSLLGGSSFSSLGISLVLLEESLGDLNVLDGGNRAIRVDEQMLLCRDPREKRDMEGPLYNHWITMPTVNRIHFR